MIIVKTPEFEPYFHEIPLLSQLIYMHNFFLLACLHSHKRVLLSLTSYIQDRGMTTPVSFARWKNIRKGQNQQL